MGEVLEDSDRNAPVRLESLRGQQPDKHAEGGVESSHSDARWQPEARAGQGREAFYVTNQAEASLPVSPRFFTLIKEHWSAVLFGRLTFAYKFTTMEGRI